MQIPSPVREALREAPEVFFGPAAPRAASPRGFLWLLLPLAAALAIGTAGWGDLYNETDGQYGGAAKVMAAGGSWLAPENNDIPRLVKPPLLYWEMAAAMKIFGVNAFAARLPGALAIVGLTLMTYLFGCRMGGPFRGAMAGVILLTSLGMFSLGRIVMPEQTLSALIAGALYCALRGHDNAVRRKRWYLAFWVCASLASFVKGWHGALYPLAIIGVAALACRNSRPRLRGLLSWQGLVVFALINLPWYFSIEAKYPGWFHNLIFTEQLGHIVGNSSPATDYTSVPRWQFLLLHLAWFFPWSIVAGGVLVANWKAWPRKARCSRVPGRLRRRAIPFSSMLVAAWAAVIFGSVMLTGQRQDYYAMSMWPAFALGAAWVLDRHSVRPGAIALAGVLGAGFVAAFFVGGLVSAPAATSLARPGFQTGTLAERTTAWTTLAGFDPSVWESLQMTAWFALGGALIFALAAVWFSKHAWPLLTSAAVCLALGAVSGTATVSPYFSLARMAPAIPRGATVIYDGGIDTGSSLLIYTDAKLILLDQNPAEEFIVRKFGIGRDRFLTTPELSARWKSGVPVLLITEAAKLSAWKDRLGALPSPRARCGTQILIGN